jgi:hypothetical protein
MLKLPSQLEKLLLKYLNVEVFDSLTYKCNNTNIESCGLLPPCHLYYIFNLPLRKRIRPSQDLVEPVLVLLSFTVVNHSISQIARSELVPATNFEQIFRLLFFSPQKNLPCLLKSDYREHGRKNRNHFRKFGSQFVSVHISDFNPAVLKQVCLVSLNLTKQMNVTHTKK